MWSSLELHRFLNCIIVCRLYLVFIFNPQSFQTANPLKRSYFSKLENCIENLKTVLKVM